MLRPVRRWESLALPFAAASGAGRYSFGDIPQLRSDTTKDIAIRAIEVFTRDTVPLDFNSIQVAALADIQNAFLTLYIEGEESYFRIPLIKMLNTYAILVNPSAWSNDVFQTQNIQVDWTKSYITAPAAFTTTTAFNMVFGVSYLRMPPGTIKQQQVVNGQYGICDAPAMM